MKYFSTVMYVAIGITIAIATGVWVATDVIPYNSAVSIKSAPIDSSSGSSTGNSVVSVSDANVKPEFKQLADYAKSKNIRWMIFCASDDVRGSAYGAWAIPPGAKFVTYAEDGAMDDWFSNSDHAKTPEEAARNLYKLLQGRPNDLIRHKPQEPARSKVQCIADVTSENYTTEQYCQVQKDGK